MPQLIAKPPKKSNQDAKKTTDSKKSPPNPGFASYNDATSTRLPIGYPSVELYFSNEALSGSIPLMYLIPGEGEFAPGLDVFTFSDKLSVFKNMLQNDYDIILKTQSNSIPIAFLPEAIPGIQLSNDYGASFLESITSVANPMLGQIGQMIGAKNIRDFVRNAPGEIGGAFGGAGAALGNKLGAGIIGAADWLKGLGEKGLDKVTPAGVSNQGLKSILATGGSVVSAMLMGSRVDFPKVWMGSGFSGPVSIPVRLYNPDQTSEVSYNKFILEPLTILLMLGAPLSDQDNLYRWPFIHQIWCPGLFKWKMASIVGITVQPGAENQMSWNNRPSMIDVRIDFQPLHSVMLGRRTSNSVPAVGDYLDQLRTKKTAPRLWDVPAGAPNVSTWSSARSDEDIFEAPGTPTHTVDIESALNPPPRVMSDDDADYADLQHKQQTSASNPAADRILAERARTVEDARRLDSINQAKQSQEALSAVDQVAAQKAVQDKKLQDQLTSSDEYAGGLPETQSNQIASRSPGPSEAELEEQGMAGNMMDGVAYQQDLDGAPPGQSKDVPKETPEGGKAPGKSDSFWSGVSSKLSAGGTAVVAAGKNVATSVIDGASSKAKQVSTAIDKVTGKTKDTGQDVKTTVTPSTTVEEARKANTFPTTSEEGVKAQVEPKVAASQNTMQLRSSAIAEENQRYSSQLQVWNDLLGKTTDPATKTFAETRISALEANHKINLTDIEKKYI
jgi:hypothetical protein